MSTTRRRGGLSPIGNQGTTASRVEWLRRNRAVSRHCRRVNRTPPVGRCCMVHDWGWSAMWWWGGQRGMPCFEVGVAALGPGVFVVCLGPGWWAVAVGGGAAVVLVVEGDLLVLGEESFGAAEVEGYGVPVEDHRDDPGAAGQPAGLARADPVSGVDGGHAEPGVQCV